MTEPTFTLPTAEEVKAHFPPVAQWLWDHLRCDERLKPSVAQQLYHELRKTWPQINEQTKVCQLPSLYYHAVRIYVQGVFRPPVPMRKAGFRPIWWRFFGKWLHRPKWVERGYFLRIPDFVKLDFPTQQFGMDFGLYGAFDLRSRPFMFVAAYVSLQDTLYIEVD